MAFRMPTGQKAKSESHQLGVSLPNSVYDRLAEFAKAGEVKVSRLVREMVVHCLDELTASAAKTATKTK